MILADLVGTAGDTRRRSWTVDDALLYAISVGAGQQDPTVELGRATENSAGHELRVLPTFVSLLGAGTMDSALRDVDVATIVYGAQRVELRRPVPLEGTAIAQAKIVGVYDKGSGALVVSEVSVADAQTGSELAVLTQSLFVRGAGGFGGKRDTGESWSPPRGEPDLRLPFRTAPNQALIYRLTGDRNRLHSDPSYAAAAGFDRPILHGLCTFGISGRLLLREALSDDDSRFRSMSGRFSTPVIPGEELTVHAWESSDGFQFLTLGEDGRVVLDQGILLKTKP